MEPTGGSTRAGLRGPPARVRGPRRLHARPARRRGAVRARVHPRRVGQAADRAVGRRADAGHAGPARHRRPDLLLLDEPTNHLDLGALEWLEEHLRRRARRRCSWRRTTGPSSTRRSTRIWELRDRRLTVFRGDYSAYHRQREERDVRAVKDADTQAEEIARERELVQRYRSHRKFSKMHEHEARLERLQAERVEAPKAGRRGCACPPARWPAAGRRGPGEIVVRIEGLVVGYLPGSRRGDARRLARHRAASVVATVPFLAAPARRPDRDRRPERRGQDDAAADDRRGAAAARRDAHLRQRRPARLPRPAARRGDPRRDRPRRAARGDPGHARRGAQLTSPGSCSAATTRSRRSASCPAASARGSSWPCSGSSRRTCSSSTSRRTTSTSRPARRSRRSCASRRRRCSSCRTTGGCSRRSATAVGRRRRPGGAVRRRLSGMAGGGGRRLDGRRRRVEAARLHGRPGPVRGRTADAADRPRRGRSPPVARPASSATRRRPGRRRQPPRDGDAAAARRSSRRTPIGARRRAVDAELTRLGLRKNQLELALGDPGGRRELRGDAAGHERACRRRARRSRRPRTPGWSSRSGRRDRPDDPRGAGRPVRIGLTGPIGCGKSTVAGWLAERGAVVDRRGPASPARCSEPGEPALDAVIARFGDAVCVERGRQARPGGARPDRLRRPGRARGLEAIVHPAVRPRILAALEDAGSGRARRWS